MNENQLVEMVREIREFCENKSIQAQHEIDSLNNTIGHSELRNWYNGYKQGIDYVLHIIEQHEENSK